MTSSPILVRPLASPSEREMHFQWADQAFSPNPSPTSVQHWQRFVITMLVGEEACTLRINGTELVLDDRLDITAETVQLTPQAFIQLVFGYRPEIWVAQQLGQSLTSDLLSILSVLFPMGHTWIPSSDWF